MKKLMASSLAAALILLSPGLPCYQALAANTARNVPGVTSAQGIGALAAPLAGLPVDAGLAAAHLSLSAPVLPGAAVPAGVIAVPALTAPAARQGTRSEEALSNFQAAADGSTARRLSASEASGEQGAVLDGIFKVSGGGDGAALDTAVAGPGAERGSGLAPAAPIAQSAPLRGRGLLVVGTPNRRPLLVEAKQAADTLGLELYLIDAPENRHLSLGVISDGRFLSQTSAELTPPSFKARRIEAVIPANDSDAEEAGRIVDLTGVRGESAEAARNAREKELSRREFSKTPEFDTTYRLELRSSQAARQAFREMGGDPVLLRSRRTGEGRLVKTGIASEDEAAAAWEAIAGQADSAGLMMERMWEGPQANVDLVYRTEQDGKLAAVVAQVSDESARRGTTSPSQLSPDHQKALVDAALRAVEALGLKSGGGVRVQMALTPEGSKALDVKKGLGDDFVAASFKEFTGVSFIEQSMRSLFAVADVSAAAVHPVAASEVQIRSPDGTIVRQRGDYKGDGVDVNAEYDKLLARAVEKRERILGGYLKGQIARLLSMVLYYSLFSPFMRATGGDKAMASGRIGYAWTLALGSPIAGVLAERLSARSVLVGAFIARATIWAGLIPGAFFFLGSGWAFASALLALNILDGAVVSIAGILDIDEGGIDILARQHHFPVDAETRVRYNAIMRGVSASARVLIAPAVAGVAVFLTLSGLLHSASVALAVVMALSFALPAVYGVIQYLRAIPKHFDRGNRDSSLTAAEELKQTASGLKDAVALAWNKPKLRWRFLLNALDRSILDSMLFVVLATFGMNVLFPDVPGKEEINKAWGTFAAAGLVGIGALGNLAMLKAMRGWQAPQEGQSWTIQDRMQSALWKMSRWITPKEIHDWKAPKAGQAKYPVYRPFFGLSLRATVASGLMAVGAWLATSGFFWPGAAAGALGSFLFNMYFIAAQLGFGNLMQGVVSEEGIDEKGNRATGRLFAIQALIELGTAALVTAVLTMLFNDVALVPAMAITFGFYLACGLITRFIAPRLLFSAAERHPK